MINDPVAVKLEKNRYWISIADSDVIYYFKGLAEGMGLNVNILTLMLIYFIKPKSKF